METASAIASSIDVVKYQRASQISTSFFSTSKWVLGYLSRNGWLYGRIVGDNEHGRSSSDGGRQRRKRRRPTRLLEVGAINTELLKASMRPKTDSQGSSEVSMYNLQVRAIDLHSMHQGIEEADFLEIAVEKDVEQRYDVIVCSMVLNCVTTAEKRGLMLCRLYHFLRPGGLCFLTLPKSCLTLSMYVDRQVFRELLETIGMSIRESKETPKICFFICERRVEPRNVADHDIAKWKQVKILHRGKKYRNDFSVVVQDDDISGSNLTFIM